MVRIFLLLPCLLAGLAWGESYEDRLAQTDLDDPDQRYELGMWCKERKMHRTAHKHFKAVLDTNPDHVPTRREMGYIMVEDEWVHESRVPAGMRPGNRTEDGGDAGGGDGTGEIPVSTGPGPKASEIEWDLGLPREPEGLERFSAHVDRYIAKLERESTMWDAIATLMLPEHRKVAAYRLAHKIREGASGLTYGTAMFMIELRRKGGPEGVRMAEDLVPFLVVSARNESNPDALYAFCTTVGQYGEKKAVPRLIQLLDHPNEDVVDGARTAIQAITFLAYDEVDAARAQAWWDRYHAASDALIYGKALEDDNPEARLNACRRLYPSQDKRIVPVLAELIANENINLAFSATHLLAKITGTDWGLSRDLSVERRKEIAEDIKTWWEDERASFVFVAFRGIDEEAGETESARTRSAIEAWIEDLDNLDKQVADGARRQLVNKGMEAAEPLYAAMAGKGSRIRQQKARDILRQITGENFGFDPFGNDEETNAAALEEWRSWLDGRIADGQREAATEDAGEGGEPSP